MKIMYLSLSKKTTGYAVFQEDKKIASGVLSDNQKKSANDPTEMLYMIESLLRKYEPQKIVTLDNSKARYLIGGIHLLCSMLSVDCLMGPPKEQIKKSLSQQVQNRQEAYALAMQQATFGG